MPTSLPSFAGNNSTTLSSYPYTPARYAPDIPTFSPFTNFAPFSPLPTPASTPNAINSSTALQAATSPFATSTFATSPLSPPLSPSPYNYVQQYQQTSMKAPWTRVEQGADSNDRLFGSSSFDQVSLPLFIFPLGATDESLIN